MDKDFKNIDDLFQSAFADESADVPAFVKTNIDRAIYSKKGKTGWIWLIGFIGVVTLSTTIYLFTTTSQTKLISKTINTTEKKSESNSGTNATVSENGLPVNSQTGIQNTMESIVNTTSSIPENDTDHSTNLNSTQLVANKENDSQTLAESKSLLDNDQKDASANTSQHNPINYNSTDKRSTDAKIIKGKSQEFSFIKPLDNRNFEFQLQSVNQLVIRNANLPSKPIQARTTIDNKNTNAVTIETENKYNPWMFSATSGINLTKSNYTSSDAAEVSLYSKSYDDKVGFESNFDVKYRLKNSLTFGTGISLSQLKENYDLFKQTINIDSTVTWTYQDIYEYDSLLDTTIWVGVDSTSSTVYDSSAVTVYDVNGINSATYLHIPFYLGTQIVRNKFRFDLFVAGRLNFLLNGSGTYINQETVQIFSKNSTGFKPWYADVVVGTAIHYQLFEHLYLSGTLKYRPQIGTIYQGLSFNRSIQSCQIGIGLSWKM